MHVLHDEQRRRLRRLMKIPWNSLDEFPNRAIRKYSFKTFFFLSAFASGGDGNKLLNHFHRFSQLKVWLFTRRSFHSANKKQFLRKNSIVENSMLTADTEIRLSADSGVRFVIRAGKSSMTSSSSYEPEIFCSFKSRLRRVSFQPGNCYII